MTVAKFIVAGPPSSGSSMVAGILHRIGIHMGDHFKGDGHNPCNYENFATRQVLDTYLHCRSHDNAQRAIGAMQAYFAVHREKHFVGLKYPAFAEMPDLLRDVLGTEFYYVFCDRDFDANIQSIRNRWSKHGTPWFALASMMLAHANVSNVSSQVWRLNPDAIVRDPRTQIVRFIETVNAVLTDNGCKTLLRPSGDEVALAVGWVERAWWHYPGQV